MRQARRAHSPIGDFGLIDHESVVFGRGQARGRPSRAVNVSDLAARAAYDVVVVVADPGFVARDRAAGLDAAQESSIGQGAQDVIHGLVRDVREVLPHSLNDRFRAGVRVGAYRREHRESGPGHSQSGTAKGVLGVGNHAPSMNPNLERIK